VKGAGLEFVVIFDDNRVIDKKCHLPKVVSKVRKVSRTTQTFEPMKRLILLVVGVASFVLLQQKAPWLTTKT
jgi:hypothetical protein